LAVLGRKTNKYHPICAAQPKTAKEAKAVAETVTVASDFEAVLAQNFANVNAP